ncbi:sulfurtransferase [Caloranaerobacter ferrireducens]|uniref:sulfurtransferase n=1 Tax=Caloranaerobacter ferrireducens TaxID=1323370 RepID=UPI00084D5D79|nr:rhodanese-like domain-containing protein [Caloranaerobacter ferrireducens]
MFKRKSLLLVLVMILLVNLIIFSGCTQKSQQEAKNVTLDDEKKSEVKVITTEELKKRLNEDNLILVDIRSSAQYNGWKLEGEKRSGHIKGAVDFPYSWIKDKKLKDEDIKRILKSKGVTTEKTVVVYDARGKNVQDMANILRSLGYENVLIYNSGIVEWSKDESLPMESLKNYEKLVHPKWINDLINGKKPDTYNNDKYVIFEVSWGPPKDYKKGHIPGAIHLDTNLIEEEPLWNRVSDEKIKKVLEDYGVTYDTTVILYGADTMAAARAASIMMYAGVEDVRLLDGGFNAWVNAGYQVEKEVRMPQPVDDFGIEVPAHPEYIIDIEEAKQILKDENALLVSIRSWDEYIGKTSGYSYIKPKGRIAGAVWGHAGSDPYHMQDYRNIDNTMRNYHEIAKNWEEWGITPDKKIAFFCGTGWRASEAFFYAYLMGWENISVYDGGWYEWSMDESNPVEFGDPRQN